MGINIYTVSAAIINFIILYFAMRHFLFKPVTNVMEGREKSIADNINKAEKNMKEAEKLKVENENILKQAKEKGKEITELRKQNAEKLYQEIVSEANKEAESIIERARIEVDREKEKAQNELKNQVVDLAVMLSAKALEESIDEKQHRKLIEDFLLKVGS